MPLSVHIKAQSDHGPHRIELATRLRLVYQACCYKLPLTFDKMETSSLI